MSTVTGRLALDKALISGTEIRGCEAMTGRRNPACILCWHKYRFWQEGRSGHCMADEEAKMQK